MDLEETIDKLEGIFPKSRSVIVEQKRRKKRIEMLSKIVDFSKNRQVLSTAMLLEEFGEKFINRFNYYFANRRTCPTKLVAEIAGILYENGIYENSYYRERWIFYSLGMDKEDCEKKLAAGYQFEMPFEKVRRARGAATFLTQKYSEPLHSLNGFYRLQSKASETLVRTEARKLYETLLPCFR